MYDKMITEKIKGDVDMIAPSSKARNTLTKQDFEYNGSIYMNRHQLNSDIPEQPYMSSYQGVGLAFVPVVRWQNGITQDVGMLVVSTRNEEALDFVLSETFSLGTHRNNVRNGQIDSSTVYDFASRRQDRFCRCLNRGREIEETFENKMSSLRSVYDRIAKDDNSAFGLLLTDFDTYVENKFQGLYQLSTGELDLYIKQVRKLSETLGVDKPLSTPVSRRIPTVPNEAFDEEKAFGDIADALGGLYQ